MNEHRIDIWFRKSKIIYNNKKTHKVLGQTIFFVKLIFKKYLETFTNKKLLKILD